MSYCAQGRLFTFEDFCDEHDDNTRLVMVLSALEPYLAPLVWKMERERIGRHNRYPVHVMMRSFIAGSRVSDSREERVDTRVASEREFEEACRDREYQPSAESLAVQPIHEQVCQRGKPRALGKCFRAVRGKAEGAIAGIGQEPGDRRDILQELVEWDEE